MEKRGKNLSVPKKIIFSTAVWIFFFSILVFILEFIFSFQVDLPSSNIRKDFRLNHTWTPNSTASLNLWGNDPVYNQPYVHVYNNQSWLENYDIKTEKPKDCYRIFYVGDSFVEGPCPMEHSLPNLVEKQLNEFFAGRRITFEVINTGTGSYSPVIYYVLIRYYLAKYSPDLIVISVDMTDVYDDWKYRETLIRDAMGNPWAVPPRDIYRSLYIDTREGSTPSSIWLKGQLFLYERSYFYNWIIALRKAKITHNDNAEPTDIALTDNLIFNRWSWIGNVWGKDTEEQVTFSMDILERIAGFCSDQGIKLILTGVPHYLQFVSGKTGGTAWSIRPHLEIQKAAEKCGAVYLDSYAFLRPLFNGSPQNQYYYTGDMHLNPLGLYCWSLAHVRAIADPQNNLLPAALYHEMSVDSIINEKYTRLMASNDSTRIGKMAGPPQDFEATIIMAKYFLRRQLPALAIEYLQRAAENPQDPHQWNLTLGLAYLQQGNLERAVIFLEKAFAYGETDPQLRATLAHSYYKLGQLEAAAVHFEALLDVNPADQDALHLLGRINQAQNRYDKAEGYYARLLKIYPEHRPTLVNMGMIEHSRRNLVKAEVYYRQALLPDGKDPSANFNLANLLAETGRKEEAIKHYKSVLEVQPEDSQTHFMLGLLYSGDPSQYVEAIRHFVALSKLKPDQADLIQRKYIKPLSERIRK